MKKKLILSSIILFFLLTLTSSQVSKIQITLNKQELSPGQNLEYYIYLYEEDKPIQKTINIEIINAYSQSEKFEINSNEKNIFKIPENAAPGYWKIKAKTNEKTTQEIFTIKENQNISFKIQDNYLIIKNTGNTIYKKDIQIIISEDVITKQVYLDINEEIKIRLIAPQGTYNVKVSDGSQTITKQNVALTGQFIGALEERTQTPLKKYSLIWIFLIIIIALATLLALKRKA